MAISSIRKKCRFMSIDFYVNYFQTFCLPIIVIFCAFRQINGAKPASR